MAEPSKVAKAVGQTKIGPALAELRKKGVVTEERTVSLPPSRRKIVRVLRLAVEPDVAAQEAAAAGTRRRGAAGASAARAGGGGGAAQPRVCPSRGLAVGASAAAAAKALSEKGLACYLEAPAPARSVPVFRLCRRDAPPPSPTPRRTPPRRSGGI